MKSNYLKTAALSVALLLTVSGFAVAQKTTVQEKNVRAHLEFLASDAMQGRGSGTQFERIAAQYLATQMMQFGIEPAGDKREDGTLDYVQTIDVTGRSYLQKLTLSNGSGGTFKLGEDFVISAIAAKDFSGELQKANFGDTVKKGAAVLVTPAETEKFSDFMSKIEKLFADGAGTVLVGETNEFRERWANYAGRRVSIGRFGNIFIVSKSAVSHLKGLADGTKIEFNGEFTEPNKTKTWNAVGKITGTDPKLKSQVILLSAHLDHLGFNPNAPGDDKIFNGADDNASGTTAVLELGRALANGKKPKRTIYFAFFGSEEAGGHGANHFVNNLGFPKENMIANLNFEMIGRADPKVKKEELWLTGYDLSNLGAELAKRGAKLVADPHPEQNFFRRSDNYTLARQGIVAHTVSSYDALDVYYHKASDEIKTLDLGHMTYAIDSMIKPIQWLANSTFIPAWHEGKKP